MGSTVIPEATETSATGAAAASEKVSEMFVVLALILIVALILAERYGTDSRDGRDWASTAGRWGSDRDIVASRN